MHFITLSVGLPIKSLNVSTFMTSMRTSHSDCTALGKAADRRNRESPLLEGASVRSVAETTDASGSGIRMRRWRIEQKRKQGV